MAQAYIRQSNFADGDTITAALFNDEYNQLVNAFAYSSSSVSSTGHRHDGTAGQGGNIFKIGDLDFLNKVEIDSTNNRIGFYTEVSSAAVEQLRIQDGAIVPVTDSDIDLGTTSLRFKDTFTDSITTTGNVDVGGNLTVTGTTTFNGGTLTLGDAADDNVVFGADVNSNIIPNTDNAYDLGSSSQEWKDLYVDGIAYLDGINFNGTAITSTAAELNLLDGVTATTTELNYVDVTTAGTVEASKAVVADSNADVLFSDNDKLKFGTSSDLQIYHDGSNSYISDSGTGNLRISGTEIDILNPDSNEFKARFKTDGAVELYHDNSKKFETTSTGVDVTGNVSFSGNIVQSSDLLIDAGGDIFLDADGGDIKFKDAGTTFVEITNSSTDAVIKSTVSDKDIIFKGNDGGSTITALTLDMSDLGTATFNHDIKLNDNGEVKFGNSQDLRIAHNGTDSFITNNTGDLYFNQLADDKDILFRSDDGSGGIATYFFLDGSGTRTQFEQHTRHIDNIYAAFGSDADLRIFHDGSDSKIQQSSGATGNLIIEQAIDDKDIILKSDDGSGGTAAYITLDGSAVLTQFDKDTKHVDSVKATFGDSSDLQIFHDGSNSFIQDAGTGDLLLRASNNLYLQSYNGAENYLRAITDGAVELYHDNSKKFETASDGIDINGVASTTFGLNIIDPSSSTHGAHFSFDDTNSKVLIGGVTSGTKNTAISIPRDTTQVDFGTHITLPDNGRIKLGQASDLQIYHDGSNSYIKEDGTGNLIIAADDFRVTNVAVDEVMIGADTDGVVSLYHNGSAKLQTTSSGVTVTGNVALTGDIQKTGQITLDASTDIALDTDSGIILLKDGGTNKGRITTASDIISIVNSTQDGDIKFDGLDGSSSITALRLDMSEGGAATFNDSVTLSDELSINGTGTAQIKINGATGNESILRFYDGGSESWMIRQTNSDNVLSFRRNSNNYLSLSASGVVSTVGDVTVGGNLTVQGTTTTLNTATLDVEDKNITLNKGSGDTSGSADGAGITIQDAVDASTDATILWDATNDEFDFSHAISAVGGTITSNLTLSGSNTGTNPAANGHIPSELKFFNSSNTDNNLNAIGFFNSSNAVDARIAGVHKSQSSRHGELAFLTHSGAALTEVMRISHDGKIGVNKTSPAVSIDAGANTDAIHVPAGTTAQRPTGAAGQFRYNTTTGNFEGYTSEWGAIAGSGGSGSSSFAKDTFTGDGSTTAFTMSTNMSTENGLIVFIDGVYQADNVYSVSGTTLTFATAPLNSRIIEVFQFKVSSIVGVAPVLATMTGDGSDTTLALGTTPDSENQTFVTIDGVVQHKDTYSISGSTLTFSTAPPNTSKVEAIIFNNVNVAKETFQDADGDTKIQVEESTDEDKIRFDTGGTERVIIDSTGVGIGTSSPTGKLEIAATGTQAAPHIKLVESGDTREFNIFNDGAGNGHLALADSDDDVPDTEIVLNDNGVITMNTVDAERMRITSGGGVGINTTVPTGAFTVQELSGQVMRSESSSSGTVTHLQFVKVSGGAAQIGAITGTTSSVSYTSGSDYRLKENVITDWDATTLLKQLKPSKFNFKDNQSETVTGFIAHEVQEVLPYLVNGEKDGEDMQSMDYAKLTPLLTKAIQEQQKLIEDLKSRIEVLETPEAE